jgi:predicted Zn-dependent protease
MTTPTRIWLALAFALVAGCEFPAGEEGASRGEGPGGREQPLALSPRQELRVGREAYAEVLEKYRGRILPENHPDVQRVKRVVARLAKAAQIEPLQREIHLRTQGYSFDWNVSVVEDRQVNAFCPHHGSERVAREQAGGGKFTRLRYDRFQESEADHIGVFLMAFAGYDPNAAVDFWKRMERMAGGREPPEILSDHPSHETRIQQLREWAPRAAAAKRAFDEGRVLK